MVDACLYRGHVMHHRIRPKRHRFVYRVFTLLIDIDRLGDLNDRLRLLSIDRANLFSFYNEDHGQRDGSALRPWVEAQLRASDIDEKPAQILLLTMPRFLGYVFNPISIYYCYSGEGQLSAIVYEVKNTFGEQHPYVFDLSSPAMTSKRFNHGCPKVFYVSPFIEAKANYKFSLNNPNKHLDVRITEFVDEKALLVATIQGERSLLTDRQLLIQAFNHPFLPQKVMASIHYEALRLWMKGIPLQPRQLGKPRSESSSLIETDS